MEFHAAHVVRPEHFRSSNHLHSILGIIEHLGAGLPKGLLVFDYRTKITHDVIGSFACCDAIENGSLDSIGKRTMHITCKRQVVLSHEIQGICIDDGEHFRC